MSARFIISWSTVAATAFLMWFLKWLHYGVTHYNIFLYILLGWSLMLIIIFRLLGETEAEKPTSQGEKA